MLVCMLTFTSALRMAPTSHVINAAPGEEVCKIFRFDVGSDNWMLDTVMAVNYSGRWSAFWFERYAGDVGQNITVTQLDDRWGMKTVDICYTFEKAGTFRGAHIVQRPYVRFWNGNWYSGHTRGAIWIKAIIE